MPEGLSLPLAALAIAGVAAMLSAAACAWLARRLTHERAARRAADAAARAVEARFEAAVRAGASAAAARAAAREAEAAQSRLADAVESLQEAFCLWDEDDRLVLCNRKFREINAAIADVIRPGVRFEEWLRTFLDRKLLPDAVGREDAWLAERLKRRRTNASFEIARQNGMSLQVQDRVLADGGVVTVALDVTERKAAEAAAAEREALLDSIFENLPAGLVIKDRNHVVLRANRSTLARYGVAKEALIGRRMEDAGVFHSSEADVAEKLEQENQVLATGAPVTRDVVQIGVDGQRRILRITKFPVFNAAGEVVQVGSAGIDLTDQLAARQALRESEARFRDFAEIASDWLWESGPDHRFVRFYAQDTPHSVIDFPRTVGKTRWEMAGPGALEDPAWQAHIAAVMAHEEFRDYEYWFVDRRGERRRVRVSGRPVYDETGTFKGYRGVGADVTAQRIAEERLRESETLLRSVIENAPNMTAIRDLDGRVVLANRAFAGLFGLSPEGVVGKAFEDLFPPDKAAEFRESHARVVRDDALTVDEQVIPTLSGALTVLALRFPIHGPDGKAALVGMTSTDISDRKAMETDLREAKARAETASRAKSSFLARMSHELRTPLNAILGFGQLMQQQSDGPIGSPSYAIYVDDIVSSGRHLLTMVNDLIEMSRIDAGQVNLRYGSVCVAAAATAEVEAAAAAAAEKRVTIRNVASSDLPAVWADPRALRSILAKLLSNAIKFSPAGAVATVETRVDPSGRIAVVVSDSGPGMTPDQIREAVEPFSTSHGAAHLYDAKHQGAGLGLSIAKGLAEAMGGDLRIEAAPGGGAAVSVTLAAASAMALDAKAVAAR